MLVFNCGNYLNRNKRQAKSNLQYLSEGLFVWHSQRGKLKYTFFTPVVVFTKALTGKIQVEINFK